MTGPGNSPFIDVDNGLYPMMIAFNSIPKVAIVPVVVIWFVGSVISETVAANSGIGYLMMVARSRFDVPLVFAGLVVVAFMGIVMYELFAWLERRVTFWATRAHEVPT